MATGEVLLLLLRCVQVRKWRAAEAVEAKAQLPTRQSGSGPVTLQVSMLVGRWLLGSSGSPVMLCVGALLAWGSKSVRGVCGA